MPNRRLQLGNMVFGNLTVIAPTTPDAKGQIKWYCQCKCGNTVEAAGSRLKYGGVKSCGCLRDTGDHGRTHGMSASSEYFIWAGFRSRCEQPTNHAYKNYGGRGVKVCDRWSSFAAFYEDMGPRPSNQHSIDRIDNGGNYEPENCRWATHGMQARNRRVNHFITFGGETKCLADWARSIAISPQHLSGRLRGGWPLSAALRAAKSVTKEEAIRLWPDGS
jgi:hypothetical protein